jgi:hypothetical protein
MSCNSIFAVEYMSERYFSRPPFDIRRHTFGKPRRSVGSGPSGACGIRRHKLRRFRHKLDKHERRTLIRGPFRGLPVRRYQRSCDRAEYNESSAQRLFPADRKLRNARKRPNRRYTPRYKLDTSGRAYFQFAIPLRNGFEFNCECTRTTDEGLFIVTVVRLLPPDWNT